MSEEQSSSGFGIFTREVLRDKTLTDKEKIVYLEISMLAMDKGYCYAKNETLAEAHGMHPNSISRVIKNLAEKNYLAIQFIKRPGKFDQRRMYPLMLQKAVLDKVLEASGYATVNDILNATVKHVLNPTVKDVLNAGVNDVLNCKVKHNIISNTNNISIPNNIISNTKVLESDAEIQHPDIHETASNEAQQTTLFNTPPKQQKTKTKKGAPSANAVATLNTATQDKNKCPVLGDAHDVYMLQFKTRYNYEPEINGIHWANLKKVLTYLKKQHPEQTWEGAVQLFAVILQQWDKLDKWRREQVMKLSFIYTQITDIYGQLTKQHNEWNAVEKAIDSTLARWQHEQQLAAASQ